MKKILLLASAASIAVIGTTHASAQTAPSGATPRDSSQTGDVAPLADDNTDIVVTGFRRSLDRASAIKRDAVTVSDVIAAEDIGKYPDTNIAESLQRVTGVQITRDRGTGGTISVRGLSPSLVQTQLNGRQIVSGRGRTFDFLTLSPDFVSSVEVQKSPTASILDGGLSATVDVKTARPLDVGRTTIAGRAEVQYNALRGGFGPRVSAIGNYVNADKTFGISLGAGYENIRNRTVDQTSYGAETAGESSKIPNLDYNRDGDFNDTYSFDHAQSFYVRTGERERYSGIAGVQWKPSSTVEFYGDAFYTSFRDYAAQPNAAPRYTNIAPATAGGSYGVRGSTIDTTLTPQLLGGSQGFLTSFDADGLDYRADSQPLTNSTSIFSAAGGAKLDFDRFHVKVEGDYSRGRFLQNFSQASALARASANITHPDGIGGTPLITFNRGFDPLNASNFNFVLIARNRLRSTDRIASGKIDLAYDVGDGFIKTVKAGVRYSSRALFSATSSSNIDAQTAASLSGGQLVYQPNVEGGSVNAASLLTPVSVNTSIPNFLPSFLAFDYDKFFAIVPQDRANQAVPYVERLGSRLDITENTTAAYFQADFADSERRLSGNVGVRYISTNIVSKGFGSNLDALTFAADGVTTVVPSGSALTSRNSYDYVLPSLNLRYDITDHLTARFAAARVLARPDFNLLGVGLNVNANVLAIDAANPQLKPFLSDQLDLSFEYYLPKSGLVSVALFYKNVDNFIVNGQVLDTRLVRRADGTTVPLTFRRNQPINLANVKLKGIEVGAQVPLYFLPGAFEGFGVFGNGTYIDAPRVPAEQNGLPFPLPGVSTFSYNIGAYFEKSGFGARAYYNWRSKYDTGNENYFGDRQVERAYGQLDGSISYDLAKNVTVSVDFENLTDSAQRRVNNFGLGRFYGLTGRRFTFGVRARY
jgi:iron complex outermembrane recepter protein